MRGHHHWCFPFHVLEPTAWSTRTSPAAATRKPALPHCSYLFAEDECGTQRSLCRACSWHGSLPRVSSRHVWVAPPGHMLVSQQQSRLRTGALVSKLGKAGLFQWWRTAMNVTDAPACIRAEWSCTSPNFQWDGHFGGECDCAMLDFVMSINCTVFNSTLFGSFLFQCL